MQNSSRLSKTVSVFRLPWPRRLISTLMIASLAFSMAIASAQAVPVGDIIFRGIQILQFSNISEQQEAQLGAQMHANLIKRGTLFNSNVAVNNYVNEIGQRLAPASRRSRLPFNFFVVQDKGVNAFATMGGYVYVTTGLLKAADNEAQVASVMSHEMGHIEKRHLIEQIRQSMIARGLVATALGTDSNRLANMGVELLVNRPLGREDEYQADQVGLRILRDANYATSAMPAFMQKLVSGGNGPTFLSTHPAVPDRLRKLQQAIKAGPTNRCDSDPRLANCGLDDAAYQANVKQRVNI
jgi:beta-barrel assembly-enhancing protease